MLARRILVNRDAPGFYHCISRCVRQAFLCGDGYDHRRGWIAKRLRELAQIFSIDVVAYAVMSNHFHVILWTDPERAQKWSNRQVAKTLGPAVPQAAQLGPHQAAGDPGDWPPTPSDSRRSARGWPT